MGSCAILTSARRGGLDSFAFSASNRSKADSYQAFELDDHNERTGQGSLILAPKILTIIAKSCVWFQITAEKHEMTDCRVWGSGSNVRLATGSNVTVDKGRGAYLQLR